NEIVGREEETQEKIIACLTGHAYVDRRRRRLGQRRRKGRSGRRSDVEVHGAKVRGCAARTFARQRARMCGSDFCGTQTRASPEPRRVGRAGRSVCVRSAGGRRAAGAKRRGALALPNAKSSAPARPPYRKAPQTKPSLALWPRSMRRLK